MMRETELKMRSQGGSLVKEVCSPVAQTHPWGKDRGFVHDYSDLRHQQRQG